MYPINEDCGDLNPEVIEQGINTRCYEKMYAEAERLHGGRFAIFCSHQVEAMDDQFYLDCTDWDDIKKAFNAWVLP